MRNLATVVALACLIASVAGCAGVNKWSLHYPSKDEPISKKSSGALKKGQPSGAHLDSPFRCFDTATGPHFCTVSWRIRFDRANNEKIRVRIVAADGGDVKETAYIDKDTGDKDWLFVMSFTPCNSKVILRLDMVDQNNKSVATQSSVQAVFVAQSCTGDDPYTNKDPPSLFKPSQLKPTDIEDELELGKLKKADGSVIKNIGD